MSGYKNHKTAGAEVLTRTRLELVSTTRLVAGFRREAV